MKPWFIIVVLSCCAASGHAQFSSIDTLKRLLNTATKEDTTRVEHLLRVADAYLYNKPDSGLLYASKAMQLAQKLRYKSGEAAAHGKMGEANWVLGDYAQAMQYYLQATSIYQQTKSPAGVSSMKSDMANLYKELGDYQQALHYYFDSRKIDEENAYDIQLMFPDITMQARLMNSDINIAEAYLGGNRLDSALFFARRGFVTNRNLSKPWGDWSYPALVLGNVYLRKGQLDSALFCYRLSFKLSGQNDLIDINNGIAASYRILNAPDSCRYYAEMAFDSAQQIRYRKGAMQASELLSWAYEKTNPSEAIRYYKTSAAIKDSLYNQEKISRVNFLVFNERQREQELQAAQVQYQTRLKLYGLVAIVGLFLLIAVFLWRSNQHRQRSYASLQKQKQETDLQRDKAEYALKKLKDTQAQLIQSEKMASLGELTAGIAHEIQNPLNFVNNFSETNTELINEAQTELKTGNHDEAYSILDDINANEQKITQHGKRAEAIVKNMLEHSRTSKGEKQATDINALVDEYLRLAYHGFRAKDKGFNTVMATQYDESIGKVNIVPQDIGRVLLNLFNNAFWAVYEKKKQAGNGYEPTLTVSTKKENDKVDILIADNGSGIPQNVIAKVFQPFFTTKPTGEGTGLGLSLSYDIVKAHGGEIHLESTEGKGSTFAIQLPLSETAKTK